MTAKIVRILFILAGGFLAGIGVTYVIQKSYLAMNSDQAIYRTSDSALMEQFSGSDPLHLQWRLLLPSDEQASLSRYPFNAQSSFDEQLSMSLRAANDKQYQSALLSTNTVTKYNDKAVRLSGFIVPIDVDAQRQIKRFFLVPYFGACIHYPPPPPNQIVYVPLDDGFGPFDLSSPYTVEGVMTQGLFEDPLATSAYIIKPVAIRQFSGQPDDFRQH